MKKFIKPAMCAMLAIGFSVSTFAQIEEKIKKEEEKKLEKISRDKKEMKDRKNVEEIVIRKTGDKDGKYTIEIKGDAVTINGKPLNEFDDDNVIVRRNKMFIWDGNAKSMVTINGSPFRDGVKIGPKAFLGVTTEKSDNGVKITMVSDKTAAIKAGLKKGDIITKVDDAKIENPEDLSKAITKHEPGDKVTIGYLRDGKAATTTAVLEDFVFTFNSTYNIVPPMPPYPDMENFHFNFDGNEKMPFLSAMGHPRIGIRAQDSEDGKGVNVMEVMDESLASKAGIKKGDVITEFDGKTINSADALAAAARDAREKTSINVKISRDGKSQTIELKVPKKLKTANL